MPHNGKKNLKKFTKKPTKIFLHWKSIQCFYGQVASISHQIDEMKRKKTFLQIKKNSLINLGNFKCGSH